MMDENGFLAAAYANPVNGEILRRLRGLGLPEAHLVAGCLFQAAWNRLTGWPPATHVKDYDIFYFDDRDLSWAAEDRVVREVADCLADLGIAIDVKNQARVHLWYRDRFGGDYPRLTSAADGIGRYLVEATCLGIEAATGRLYAPYGLADLAAGRLRINPAHARPDLFAAKAASYRARWPWLEICAQGAG